MTDAELEQSCAEHQGLRDRITELERALTPFANYGLALNHLAKNGQWVGENWAANLEHPIGKCAGRVITVGHFIGAAEALKERPW